MNTFNKVDKIKMDKKERLHGEIKEVLEEVLPKSERDEIHAKAEKIEEDNAKILEQNSELKEKLDAWQGKEFTLNQNTGQNTYVFKGFNPDVNKNLRSKCSKEVGEKAAEIMIKALTNANTGAYAIPVEYGNALLGLAELKSYALSRARVIKYPGEVMYMPTKGTRATVDAQAFGTANADAAATLGRLTFTIDKRVGDYITVYDNVLKQKNFDIVGEFIEPLMSEAIGQNFDGEMFTKTEFTTDIAAGGSAGTTFSGTIGTSSITYAGLVDTMYAVEHERGLSPEWCLPRGVWKYVMQLVDNNGKPLWERAMEGPGNAQLMGYPVYFVPAIDATPADGAICGAFGDPKQYIIAVNQDFVFEVDPIGASGRKVGTTDFVMHATADGNIVDSGAWATIKRSD